MRHQGLVLRMFDVRCLTADSKMRKVLFILIGVALLLSCGGRKNADETYINDMEEALRVRD